MEVAKQIRMAIAASGKTAKEVADAVGVHAQTVSRWQTGQTAPRVSEFADLADVCGLNATIAIHFDSDESE